MVHTLIYFHGAAFIIFQTENIYIADYIIFQLNIAYGVVFIIF